MVAIRKVTKQGVVSIRETVGEYEVGDIIFFSGVSGMLSSSSNVGLRNKFQELKGGGFGRPVDRRSVEDFRYKFHFSMDECNVLERLAELREL